MCYLQTKKYDIKIDLEHEIESGSEFNFVDSEELFFLKYKSKIIKNTLNNVFVNFHHWIQT